MRFNGAGLAYHVVARGNNKMPIFLDHLDCAQFLHGYGDVIERFQIDGWLHCLMKTHYHLVFRTHEPNLSLAIRHLNGSYAQWWNKRHRHIGHVFQGRFKAQIVESGVYLQRLCRYVLRNPVRAGLVAHPADWRWSSCAALASGARHRCVDAASLLQALDPDNQDTVRERLLRFVEPDDDPEMRDFVRSDQRVIGSRDYAARFSSRALAASTEVPIRDRRTGAPSLSALIAAAVESGEGLAGGVRRARAALYEIGEIALCAGLSISTVTRIINGSAGDPRGTSRSRRRHGMPPRQSVQT